jgi:hypothetical protein
MAHRLRYRPCTMLFSVNVFINEYIICFVLGATLGSHVSSFLYSSNDLLFFFFSIVASILLRQAKPSLRCDVQRRTQFGSRCAAALRCNTGKARCLKLYPSPPFFLKPIASA